MFLSIVDCGFDGNSGDSSGGGGGGGDVGSLSGLATILAWLMAGLGSLLPSCPFVLVLMISCLLLS